MTDRHAGYVVTLDHDMREDDAEALIAALTMLKGVIRVEPVIGDANLQIAETRARFELGNALLDQPYTKKD